MTGTDPFASERLPEENRPPRSEEIDSHSLAHEMICAPIGPVDWREPSLEEVGRWFPNLKLLAFIGRGGMGAVYKACQTSLDRLVAIKILPAEMREEEDFGARFEQEAKVLARLSHPRIVSVIDSGTTEDGHAYFIMEYVEGATLHALIEAKKLTTTQSLQILADVCEGLGYAHKNGVVHRDVKPANVLVDKHGRAKVADFGIARLTLPDTVKAVTTRQLFGTPDYMAPEQLERRAVDHRADIYALGVMLYELLCHQLPRGHVDPPSVRAGVDHRLDIIVAKAMHNAPDRRYQQTVELLTELRLVPMANGVELLLTDHGGNPSLSEPTRLIKRRQFIRRWGLTLLVLLAAIVAGVMFLPHQAAPKNPPRTTPAAPTKAPDHPNVLPKPLVVAPDEPGTEGIPWHDWIAEEVQGKGVLPAGLVETPQGLEVHASTEKGVYLVCGNEMFDQTVRVTYLPAADGSDAGLQLVARSSSDFKALYRAHAYSADWVLLRREPDGRLITLATVDRTADFRAMAPRTVELGAIGETLSFYFNGVLQRTVQDARLHKGRLRIFCGDGLVFQKIEYRDLTK